MANYRYTYEYFSRLSEKDKHNYILKHWKFHKNDSDEYSDNDTIINYSCNDSMCDLSHVLNTVKNTISNKNRFHIISDIITDITTNQSEYLPHITGKYIIKSREHTIRLHRADASSDCSVGTIQAENLLPPKMKYSDVFQFV
jgi:hypothetical protein